MTNTVLPPGVSLELFDSLPKSTLFFDGDGQAGNWADVNNWWGGKLPVTGSTVVVPVNATLNGSFTAANVMFLGTGTVTVNGDLSSLNPNQCESFMVCDQAVAVFNAGSALNDAGALIVGNDDNGTMTANGGVSGYATLTSAQGIVGRLDGGIGSLTINGAHWSNTNAVLVGEMGAGTLNITNGGLVSTGGNVVLGQNAGANGVIDLSGGGTLSVGASLDLGFGQTMPGGSGTSSMSIGAASEVSFDAGMNICAGNAVSLSGGSLVAGTYASPLVVHAGGTLAGFGTVTDLSGGISDSGTITASGGTLLLNGTVSGPGVLQIAANSIADVNGPTLGKVGVVFGGTNATLDLAHAVNYAGVITDFAAGDSIVMPGVTGMSWNAATHVLALTDLGHQVDKLDFAGSYTSASFTLSQSGAGAVIGFNPGH